MREVKVIRRKVGREEEERRAEEEGELRPTIDVTSL
jgi:hypothetical protein